MLACNGIPDTGDIAHARQRLFVLQIALHKETIALSPWPQRDVFVLRQSFCAETCSKPCSGSAVTQRHWTRTIGMSYGAHRA